MIRMVKINVPGTTSFTNSGSSDNKATELSPARRLEAGGPGQAQHTTGVIKDEGCFQVSALPPFACLVSAQRGFSSSKSNVCSRSRRKGRGERAPSASRSSPEAVAALQTASHTLQVPSPAHGHTMDSRWKRDRTEGTGIQLRIVSICSREPSTFA